MKIFKGDLETIGDLLDSVEAASQVSIVNTNNDQHLDLFGEIEVLDVNGTVQLQRVFWINNPSHPGKFNPPMNDPNGNAPLAAFRSSAFVGMYMKF